MTGLTNREASPLVAIRDLTVAFDGVKVLHGIDLAIHRGEAVGLVGESGSRPSASCRRRRRFPAASCWMAAS